MVAAVVLITAVAAIDAGIVTDRAGMRAGTGMRDDDASPGLQRDSAGYLTLNGHRLNADAGSRGVYRGACGRVDNHLDISREARENCVTGHVTNENADGTRARRTALVDGASCHDNANDAATCVGKYEAKYRQDHRAGDHGGSPGRRSSDDRFSMYGEVHLCEWLPLMEACEAGEALTVCPEASEATPYVVEVFVGATSSSPAPTPATPGGHGVAGALTVGCSANIATLIPALSGALAGLTGVTGINIGVTSSNCPAGASLAEAAEAGAGTQISVIVCERDVPDPAVLQKVITTLKAEQVNGLAHLKTVLGQLCTSDAQVQAAVAATHTKTCAGLQDELNAITSVEEFVD